MAVLGVAVQLSTSCLMAQHVVVLKPYLWTVKNSKPTLAGPLPLVSTQATEALTARAVLLPHCHARSIQGICAPPAVVGSCIYCDKHPEKEGCCVGYVGNAGSEQ